MTPTEAAIHRSKTVSVMVNGSPCSTLALLWTLQHGGASPRIVMIDELDPLSRSYVDAIASLFGLERPVPPTASLFGADDEPHAVVWGARLGKAVEKQKGQRARQATAALGAVTNVRPLVGYSEAKVLDELQALGIRPHPAFALGIGPATIERLRDEADRMQIDTMDQALAVMAIKRGRVDIDDLVLAPPSSAPDEEPVAAPIPKGKRKAPDYVERIKKATTADEGRRALHDQYEELRGISMAVLQNINPPNDYVDADKYGAKLLRPRLEDFFEKASARSPEMGARALELYEQRRAMKPYWEALYAKELRARNG